MIARHDSRPAGPAATPRTVDPSRRPVRSSCLLALGRVKVDGREVELVWSTLSDTVLADFCGIEPRRIGTAVIGGRAEPAFVAQPDHLDWLGYEDREARILHIAVRMYRQRQGLSHLHQGDGE